MRRVFAFNREFQLDTLPAAQVGAADEDSQIAI
jgi:hypothetical protein